MEVFSMLRYWRGGGGGGGGGAVGGGGAGTPATTISATALQPSYDDGPFFDLEFSVPDEEEGRSSNSSSTTTSSGRDEEDAEDEEARDSLTEIKSFDVTVSDNGQSDSNHSPAAEDEEEELFIKGRLVPLEPSGAAVIFNDESQGKQAQFPVSLLKSATRFRVFFLGLKKHPQLPATATAAAVTPPAESPAGETTGDVASTKAKHHQSRFFTVKLKVEEAPLASLFTRDNSRSGSKAKDTPESGGDSGQAPPAGLTEKEAKRAKVVMQRYLKAIKPLYERVSKKHGEKVSISGHLSLATPAKPSSPEAAPETPPASAAPAAPPSRQGNLPAGLRVVYKRLGKSRSASASAATTVFVQSQRRDDSLLQQQDGIQSAIAHCKRSLKSASNAAPPSPNSHKDKVEQRNAETGCGSTH